MNRFLMLRYEKGLTRAEVAIGSGVTAQTLKRLENDDTDTPSAPTVKKLADYYEVPVADLLGLKDAA
jgi:transcriptional regulator with XRE-family HTH domain